MRSHWPNLLWLLLAISAVADVRAQRASETVQHSISSSPVTVVRSAAAKAESPAVSDGTDASTAPLIPLQLLLAPARYREPQVSNVNYMLIMLWLTQLILIPALLTRHSGNSQWFPASLTATSMPDAVYSRRCLICLSHHRMYISCIHSRYGAAHGLLTCTQHPCSSVTMSAVTCCFTPSHVPAIPAHVWLCYH
jgi:hypothetical protein